MRGLLFDSDLGVGAIILVTCNAHILTWRVWRQGLCCCSVADSEFLFESTAQLLFFSECHDKPKTGNSSACKAWSTEFFGVVLVQNLVQNYKMEYKRFRLSRGLSLCRVAPTSNLGSRVAVYLNLQCNATSEVRERAQFLPLFLLPAWCCSPP